MPLVAHLPDRGLTGRQDHVYLTGRQLDVGIAPFFSHQLGKAAGTSHQLATSSRSQLYVMDLGTGGDVPKRQNITRRDIRLLAGYQRIPYVDSIRGNDVPFLPIRIVQQGNSG
jgi:hypothetical protein